MIHSWDTEKREVRQGSVIREGSLEERGPVGVAGEGRERQAGRGYSGGGDLAQPRREATVCQPEQVHGGATDAGVYTPETGGKLRLTALSPSGKQRFKFTKTRRGKGSE